MKKLFSTTALAAILMTASTAAFAGSCPLEMKKIDEALAMNPGISSEQMSQVMTLRADGEAHHKAGKHGESVAALQKAKQILGID